MACDRPSFAGGFLMGLAQEGFCRDLPACLMMVQPGIESIKSFQGFSGPPANPVCSIISASLIRIYHAQVLCGPDKLLQERIKACILHKGCLQIDIIEILFPEGKID